MLKHIEKQAERKMGRIFVEENIQLRKLDRLFSRISAEHGMDYRSVARLIDRRKQYVSVPASIFRNRLSPLENVVLYLDMKFGISQSRMAEMLKRDHTTIWTTLTNIKRKGGKRVYNEFIKGHEGGDENLLIPVQILADRKLSILESVCFYLKEKFSMSYHEIALLLGKNDRTIWTVINRARKKISK